MSTELGAREGYSLFTDSDDRNLLISTQDPITQYNKFIACYNQESNQINGIALIPMRSSRMVQFVHNYLRHYMGIMMLICIFLLLPFINLVFYTLLWIAWYKLYRNERVHDDNLKSVINPLQNMIESPEICSMMCQNTWQFNIDVSETDGLQFSTKIKDMIKERSNGGNKIKFTVYNEQFSNQYYEYPNQKIIYMKWIALYTLILIVQMVLIVLFFKDF